MSIFKRFFNTEKRADESIVPEISTELLRLFITGEGIDKGVAMGIPAVASAVNLISSIGANVNYKLYSYDNGGKLKEEDDYRVKLFNKNTGDLLNGYEMKRAFIRDYLLSGNGYIYIAMKRNEVLSLHYVDEINVSVDKNCDPIFKRAKYIVDGKEYFPDNFITIARNSIDGVTGKGLLQENTLVLRLINNMMKMLNSNVAGGGVKRGFLKSQRVLSEPAMDKLKEDFAKMYNNTDIATVVLNAGLDWTPATESSTEMQIKELYEGIGTDVGEILLVPENIKNGSAGETEYRNWFKNCIVPVLNEVSSALNETMLLESEKGTYFWKADTSELENGDLKSMFEAYSIALTGNIMQLDEVREKMGLPPLGFNYIKLGLDTVLIDPDKNIVYTPNTNMVQNFKECGDSKIGKAEF